MRIAIMGSGGVGGYFGARLAQGGADVTFIARGAHLAAMRERGLSIEGAKPNLSMKVNATDDPATVGPVDLVLFAVKLWDTDSALEQMKPLVGKDTAVVSFQNGVEKDVALGRAIGSAHVLGGVAYIAAEIARPGVVRQTGVTQRLVFGEFDGRRSERAEALLDACLRGGIDAVLSADIRREIWEKYVFLVGLSGTTAATRSPIGMVREHPGTRAFLLDLMREVVAVGRAEGVDLPDDCAEKRLAFADTLAYDMTSSMHNDLKNGRSLELRWLSGGVVELGKKHGMSTPLNRATAAILALYADGPPKARTSP
jgi:2-dehydropantoate 2-reductase